MKVLVATDGSEHSMKAVQRALELAEKQDAQVTLMSVAYYVADYLEGMPPNIQDKLEDEARAALKKGKALFDAKNLPVETVMEAGLVPANLIIQKAQDGKFDRIVIGSTGQNALERIFMGSTAAKVVAHAPCEVTVVR
jgi:nucleotide-binding universal stress UspA family protein